MNCKKPGVKMISVLGTQICREAFVRGKLVKQKQKVVGVLQYNNCHRSMCAAVVFCVGLVCHILQELEQISGQTMLGKDRQRWFNVRTILI